LERHDELAAWMATVPANADKHPEYWYIRGNVLMQSAEFQQAARCFVETIKLDRRHVGAHQGIADCLLEMKQQEAAQRMREVASGLIRINDLVQQILMGHADKGAYLEIAKTYGKLGDVIGEFGWTAIDSAQRNKAFTPEIVQQQKKLASGVPNEPAALAFLNYQDWTLPAFASATASQQRPVETAPSDASLPILMEDIAERLGVLSRYDNGAKVDRGWYTIEGFGGGVSVLDYDLDGWPDLYFSEAGDSALSEKPTFKGKQLYRSIQASRFAEVANAACVADLGYGQGTGAADIDQDGFQDILVANLGRIMFYRNQGDGTFESVELPQADSQSVWNSSINAADVNDDGLPDIIQGCYTYGQESLTRWCAVPNTNRGSCHPKSFPPGRNRILFNMGDGTWTEPGAPLLDSIRQGYTLGTLTTNLDQLEGNDVFFANDVSPNHLLLSKKDAETGKRYLVESAAASGVSVDGVGRAQACMGIACGDQNRDGMLDFIVSNFRNEFSTLYMQSIPGIFVDATRRSGLGMPTLPWVSFGCQLTDLDNDGWLDYVAVNGHIDDYRHENTPWQMPSQILCNESGKFRWLKSPSPGKYFDGEWIGRGLSALDFNRDGKMDMVATHLDRGAALLENRSPGNNHYIQLELVGTHCEREAVGAIIHISNGKQRWVTSVNSGEGFYGSNQRLVHVGLGTESVIDELVIDWPQGNSEKFANVAVDRCIRIVEGLGLSE
jgi:hypothetical protein